MDSYFVFDTDKRTSVALGAEYSAKNFKYYVPMNIEALKEVNVKVQDSRIPSLIEELTKIRKQKEEIKNGKTVPIHDERLRDYQNKDVEFMLQNENPAVFNSPRTGKTPTTLIYLREKGFKKVVIAVPSSIVLVWAEEVERWLGKKAIVVAGKKSEREAVVDSLKTMEEFIAVISYDTLKLCAFKFMFKFDCFVVDEAHFLRNKKTSRSIAVTTVGRVANHRVALTGTPAVKHASDVWYILNFLYPRVYTGYWKFVNRYFNMTFDAYTGNEVPSTLKEERKEEFLNLIDSLCTQRKLHEVVDWIPEVTHYPLVKLDFEKTQYKQYKDMLNKFVAESTTGLTQVDAPNALSKIMRLRQIALDPFLVGLDGKSPKTEWILDYIKDNPDEPLIVFSNFTSYLNKLKRLMPKACIVTGEQTKEQKLKNIQDFQKGSSNVILVNTQAGGMGITLDRAVTEIFADFVWSPHEQEQAEARFLPTTKEKVSPRGVYYLFMRNSVDYHMLDRVNLKARSANYVNNIQIAINNMKEEGLIK